MQADPIRPDAILSENKLWGTCKKSCCTKGVQFFFGDITPKPTYALSLSHHMALPSHFTVRQLQYDDDCTRGGGPGGPSVCLIVSAIVVLVFLFSMTPSRTGVPVGPRYNHVQTQLAAMKAAISAKVSNSIHPHIRNVRDVGALLKLVETHKEGEMFIIIHANWCGHCTNLIEQVNKICEENKKHKNLPLIAMCEESNYKPNPSLPPVTYYPTIWHCKKGSTECTPIPPGELHSHLTTLSTNTSTSSQEGQASVSAKRGWVLQDKTRVEPEHDPSLESTNEREETDPFTGLFG